MKSASPKHLGESVALIALLVIASLGIFALIGFGTFL